MEHGNTICPLFLRIAEQIEEDILASRLAEEERVPSTNQFAARYQINPATAAKGVHRLVDQGVLYKKRGRGMYVAPGSRERVLAKRREQFFEQYVVTTMREAETLGITLDQVAEMIQRGYRCDEPCGRAPVPDQSVEIGTAPP